VLALRQQNDEVECGTHGNSLPARLEIVSLVQHCCVFFLERSPQCMLDLSAELKHWRSSETEELIGMR
jgi:hypothetical protein